MSFAIQGTGGFSRDDLKTALANPTIRAEILDILNGEDREADFDASYDDDSDRSCKDCPPGECNGHCMSCSYRTV